jgi:hypothetical protein
MQIHYTSQPMLSVERLHKFEKVVGIIFVQSCCRFTQYEKIAVFASAFAISTNCCFPTLRFLTCVVFFSLRPNLFISAAASLLVSSQFVMPFLVLSFPRRIYSAIV